MRPTKVSSGHLQQLYVSDFSRSGISLHEFLSMAPKNERIMAAATRMIASHARDPFPNATSVQEKLDEYHKEARLAICNRLGDVLANKTTTEANAYIRGNGLVSTLNVVLDALPCGAPQYVYYESLGVKNPTETYDEFKTGMVSELQRTWFSYNEKPHLSGFDKVHMKRYFGKHMTLSQENRPIVVGGSVGKQLFSTSKISDDPVPSSSLQVFDDSDAVSCRIFEVDRKSKHTKHKDGHHKTMTEETSVRGTVDTHIFTVDRKKHGSKHERHGSTHPSDQVDAVASGRIERSIFTVNRKENGAKHSGKKSSSSSSSSSSSDEDRHSGIVDIPPPLSPRSLPEATADSDEEDVAAQIGLAIRGSVAGNPIDLPTASAPDTRALTWLINYTASNPQFLSSVSRPTFFAPSDDVWRTSEPGQLAALKSRPRRFLECHLASAVRGEEGHFVSVGGRKFHLSQIKTHKNSRGGHMVHRAVVNGQEITLIPVSEIVMPK